MGKREERREAEGKGRGKRCWEEVKEGKKSGRGRERERRERGETKKKEEHREEKTKREWTE